MTSTRNGTVIRAIADRLLALPFDKEAGENAVIHYLTILDGKEIETDHDYLRGALLQATEGPKRDLPITNRVLQHIALEKERCKVHPFPRYNDHRTPPPMPNHEPEGRAYSLRGRR